MCSSLVQIAGWATTTMHGNDTAKANEGLVGYSCSQSFIERAKDVATDGANIADGCSFHWDVRFLFLFSCRIQFVF